MSLARIIIVGVVALVLGVGSYYFARQIRSAPGECTCSSDPGSEVGWMKSEFGLSDEEFGKVEELHLAYVPLCDEYCCRIAEASERVRKLAAASDTMTPELAAALEEDERTRTACRQALLDHLYRTAGCMAPEKGGRFLKMALPKVLSPSHPDVHSAVSH